MLNVFILPLCTTKTVVEVMRWYSEMNHVENSLVFKVLYIHQLMHQ
jgi:hypothetical protein